MSVFQERVVRCPRCSAAVHCTVAVSLNGPRVPAVVAAIRAGTFQRVACPECGAAVIADGPLMYTDFAQRHWVGVFPRPWEGSWRVLEHQPGESFRRAMVDHAAPVARGMADGFTVRTAFGLPALAEKLACWDAGLDDRVLEVLKLDLFRPPVSLPLSLDGRPRLVAVEGDGQVLALAAPDGVVRIDRAAYEEVASNPHRFAATLDAVAAGPYVDTGRILLTGDADPDWSAVWAAGAFGQLSAQAR